MEQHAAVSLQGRHSVRQSLAAADLRLGGFDVQVGQRLVGDEDRDVGVEFVLPSDVDRALAEFDGGNFAGRRDAHDLRLRIVAGNGELQILLRE